VNLRYIDWIWHVRGSAALAPGQSSDDAFDRLDPLFHQSGTSHERTGSTLVFKKQDQAAQDKMSVFDSGTLKVEDGEDGRVLRYDLISRALLYCFLAPLLFLGIAQITIAIGKYEKASAAAEKAAGKAKKPEAKKPDAPMNPVDKFLGAPAPDKAKKKDDDGDGGDDGGGPKKKRSPTPAYVFAGIFAALYVIGRILEAWLVNTLFRKRLQGV
jgi:hypothetical protein